MRKTVGKENRKYRYLQDYRLLERITGKLRYRNDVKPPNVRGKNITL